ncbi:MAG: hypothetical protein WC979_02700 [Candidatus Pacearchaeota archaeon]|jgi:hypothetical protein|nr:hypothetical protein [Clostridia bacterium]
MDKSLERLLELFNERKGQFLITGYHNVARLIGIGGDEHDYFLIYWDGRKLSFDSPLCPQIPLKGKIDEEYYNELVRIAKLNDWFLIADDDIKKEAIDKAKKEILQSEGHELYTELYVEIN